MVNIAQAAVLGGVAQGCFAKACTELVEVTPPGEIFSEERE